MSKLQFQVAGGPNLELHVKKATCVGYSGRNQELVKKHIDELAHEGIAPPPNVPMAYPVSNLLVTQEEDVHVLGAKTSGEVEFVLLLTNGETYVTVGSDHTDRELEGYSIPYAKQATPKPVAKQAWVLNEVLGHWDNVKLTCEIKKNGEWYVYQEGPVANVMPVSDILAFAKKRDVIDQAGTVLFCGTVPILGGTFQYGEAYRLTIHDPNLERTIQHTYNVTDVTVDNS